jgi:hypothetical protein
MTKRLSVTATQLAVAALCGSVVVFAVGVVVYGRDDMGPHIFAAAGAILAEVPLVVLVIDKLADAKRRREWSFVKQMVGKRMAAVAVDIVSLNGVRWSPLAHRDNLGLYAYRRRLAEVHLAGLRSQLEGLTLGSTPLDYDAARRIELRLAWLVSDLRKPPEVPRPPGNELPILIATMHLVASFLGPAAQPPSISAEAKAASPASHDSPAAPNTNDAFWLARMQAQAQLLKERDRAADTDIKVEDATSSYSQPPASIIYDIDGDLALSYFQIDFALLVSPPPASPPITDSDSAE